MDPNTAAVYLHLNELRRRVAGYDIRQSPGPSEQGRLATELDAMAAEAGEVYEHFRTLEGEPAIRDEAAGFYRNLAALNSWVDGREAVSVGWMERAVELAGSPGLRAELADEHRRSVDRRDFADVFRIAERGEGLKAHAWLRSMRKKETDPERRRRIDAILDEPRNFVTPASAPGLSTINGIGTGLYGSRSARGDGTYVSTLCFCLLFIPLIPFSSWLVMRDGGGWRVFGKVPLSPFAIWWRRLALGVPLFVLLPYFSWLIYMNSDSRRERIHLDQAEVALNAGDRDGAFLHLRGAERSTDRDRCARRDALGRRLLREILEGDVETFLASLLATQMRISLVQHWFQDGALQERFRERVLAVEDGRTALALLVWGTQVAQPLRERASPISAEACDKSDHAELLLACLRWHVEDRRPAPVHLAQRLRERLDRGRNETWDADALLYLQCAPPETARPILYARVEAYWKRDKEDPALLVLVDRVPEPLRSLMQIDVERLPPRQRAERLEKVPKELAEPQATWHRLGLARRLADAYWTLNEEDPVRYPVSKALPWAMEACEIDPTDGGMRARAMECLLVEGEFEKAVELGAKHAADEATIPWLGIAQARLGRADDAERTLAPYVKRRWPEFAGAYRGWVRGIGEIRSRAYETVRTGRGDQGLLARIQNVSDADLPRVIDLWIREQASADPKLAKLEEAWKPLVAARPAAREYAMVLLAKRTRLEEAEKIFLGLRDISGEGSEEELRLGQVYCWLGKETEARTIFDRVQASGDASTLLQLGRIFRELGRWPEARTVLEAAYAKSTGELQAQAAMMRALTPLHLQDKLAWLEKSDTRNPFVQTCLTEARAELWMEEGKWAEAIGSLRQVAEYYGKQTSSTALNNGALVQQSLFVATGDAKYLTEAQRLIRQGLDREPDSGILLNNYVSILLQYGILTLCGDRLRPDLLHQHPDTVWLHFAYPDPKERVAKVRAQAELRRSAETGARAALLSSGETRGLDAQIHVAVLARDVETLRRLRAGSEPSDSEEEPDEGELRAMRAMIARGEAALAAIRKAGHARSLACALSQLSSLHWREGTIDRAIECAEEAVKVCDLPITRQRLRLLLLARASQSLAAGDETYRRWAGEKRHAGTTLWLYARRHPDRGEAIAALPDVKRSAESAAGEAEPDLDDWISLALARHSGADAALRIVREDAVGLEAEWIAWLRTPSQAPRAYAAAIAHGNDELRKIVIEDAKKRKILPEFFDEAR